MQNLSTAVRPRVQQPIYAIRLPGSQSVSTSSASTLNTDVRTSSSGLYFVTKPSANGVYTAASISQSAVHAGSPHGVTIPAGLQPSSTPILAASAKMVLMVEVTNVWFGAARCKPCRPVVISEQGIKLVFKDSDNSKFI